MPANLTPQYQKAEDEFRRAQSAAEKIAALETMLQLIPKHKGTEKLQADLRTRLKETRADLQHEKKAAKKGRSYKIPRQGAGQWILIGAPNSGKSRIVADLTGAHPDVADYPFTTREPLPAMMPWEDVTVQLIDTPPVTANHIEAYLSSMVRAADGVLLCMNGGSDDAPDETLEVVEQFHARKTMLSNRTRFSDEDFSVLEVKTLLVVTRGDDPGVDDRLRYLAEILAANFDRIRVDLDHGDSREALRNMIYRELNVIRAYTKPPGKPPDYSSPYTIPNGGTVADLAAQMHREMAETLKYAQVWGKSAIDGQVVGRDHQLCDKDLVELHV